jgi:hypothetical protein
MKYPRAILIHIIMPLAIGGLVYLLLRSNSWIHVQLFSPGSDLPVIKSHGFMADILKYNLADFCWSYSLASSLFVWKKWWGAPIPLFSLWVLLILAGSELIQLIPGSDFRFDPIDLFAAFLAFGLSFYFLHQPAKTKNLSS